MNQHLNMDQEVFFVRQKPAFNENDVEEKSPCGRYLRYKKLLGRGAFKDVYKGFDQINKTEIAWNQICVDDETTLKSQESRESLCYEAVLLKSLHHKNVMKCYGYWIDEENQNVNLITELFPSGSLRQYMKKYGGVELETIKNWGRQILQGLHYLHTQNPPIIHRDIKCDNVFLDVQNGEVKIGDFGLATALQQVPLRALAGTPEFMAPEYYDEEYNELVDVYAFGLCLMELVTSEYPYAECTNPAQIFKKVSSGIRPIGLGKVKDPEVMAIIEKCLSPASMRPSAMELLKDSFFASEGLMEIEQSSRSSSMISCVDFSSSVAGMGMLDESTANYSSSMEVALGDDLMDGSVWNGDDQYVGVKKYSIHESVLSDISALYKSMVVSDAKHDRLPSSCNYQSSMGDVSMNSKITFDSSSVAALQDLGFCMSKAS